MPSNSTPLSQIKAKAFGPGLTMEGAMTYQDKVTRFFYLDILKDTWGAELYQEVYDYYTQITWLREIVAEEEKENKREDFQKTYTWQASGWSGDDISISSKEAYQKRMNAKAKLAEPKDENKAGIAQVARMAKARKEANDD